ncbi:MAG: hypothetical protein EXR27_08750 [Betaproteobacteria bacterium]|nr:hypothetical protein [Betaproteobacteria bacterium]
MISMSEQYRHPSAWRSADMAARDDWILKLDARDIGELDAALGRAKRAGIGLPELSKGDFDLPTLGNKLANALAEVENGRGFVQIRGFPVERYSKPDAALVYWGLGSHLGTASAQNAQGEMLGHVRDVGADSRVDAKARGYQTRHALEFHTDSTDVVGLLCLRKAKSGGMSRFASTTAIYNAILAARPELARALYEPVCVDRRGEEPAGHKPYFVMPMLNYFQGRLFIRHLHSYIVSAQRFEGVPKLNALQLEALDLMDMLANDESFYLEVPFEPGDMQFLNNYVITHARTDYEDHPEPDRKRHLLRLWLRTPGHRELPPQFAERNGDMLAWLKNPRPPVFDASEIAVVMK